MKFIEEVRSIKTEYILRDDLKEKIIESAKDNKDYLIMLLPDLSEYDVKALEKEEFTVTIESKKELDCKNEYYDRKYYKISW
jgi:hypothetical protein